MILKKSKMMMSIMFIIVFLLGGWIYYTNTHIETTEYSIVNYKIPDDFHHFKIAEIADLHNQEWDDQLVNQLEKAKPDMIAITGDFVDSSHTNFDISIQFIKDVKHIAPIYYVTGNHEAWMGNYHEFKELLLEEDVIVLDNENIVFKKGDSEINIIGLLDPDFIERTNIKGIQDDIIEKTLTPLINKDLYNIVLSHRPEVFKSYVSAQADLVLTGHAHGGQVRIPFVGGLVAPNQGFFPRYTEGLHHKDNTDMIISRGLGNSIIPIRINNMPELVIVEFKNKK